MRKLACLFGLGMLFLLAQTAAAQDTPNVDAFLGYSYVRANPATSGAPSFNLHRGTTPVEIETGRTGSCRVGAHVGIAEKCIHLRGILRRSRLRQQEKHSQSK